MTLTTKMVVIILTGFGSQLVACFFNHSAWHSMVHNIDGPVEEYSMNIEAKVQRLC